MRGLRCVWYCSVAINVSGKKHQGLFTSCAQSALQSAQTGLLLFLRKRLDKCIASVNARQFVLLCCWQFQIWNCYIWKQTALFSVHGSQCFVFTVHSVWCSRDFYVATFLSGLANQKPCNVSHHIAPAGLWRMCRRRITVSHHLTQPTTILLHLLHGALTFLIGKLRRFHHEVFLSTILSSLVPLRDFTTSRILSNSLSSRVSKMRWKFTLPCSSFNSKFSCLVLMEWM